jgi:hypothetical protein
MKDFFDDYGDSLIHAAVAPLLVLLIAVTIHAFGAIFAGAIINAAFWYLREATQEQTKRHDSDFLSGWTGWSFKKHMEWVAPTVAGFIAATSIHLWINN